MTDTFHLTVPLRAAPQGSKRHVGSGRMVEMAGAGLKVYRSGVAAAARKQAVESFQGPVGVSVSFTFRRPKSHYLKAGLRVDAPRCCYPAKRGDVDKLIRSTLDALTGVVFRDDAQVVTVTGTVLWGDEDRTSIIVSEVEDLVDLWMTGLVAE